MNSVSGSLRGKEKANWDIAEVREKVKQRHIFLLRRWPQDSKQLTFTAHREGIRGTREQRGALVSNAVGVSCGFWKLDYSDITKISYLKCTKDNRQAYLG